MGNKLTQKKSLSNELSEEEVEKRIIGRVLKIKRSNKLKEKLGGKVVTWNKSKQIPKLYKVGELKMSNLCIIQIVSKDGKIKPFYQLSCYIDKKGWDISNSSGIYTDMFKVTKWSEINP